MVFSELKKHINIDHFRDFTKVVFSISKGETS
nr:MAG TPA: hypothetical protein [Caudoviricetes sp.]